MLWEVSALKCSIFQTTDFSRFLINRTCCSIDRKCDKNFGYNLSGSIGAGSIEIDFRSIKSNFQPIENRSKSFLKQAFLTYSSLYSNFSNNILLSLFDQSTSSQFLSSSSYFSQGFCLQVPVRPFYPFVFILFTYFMHFRWNFQTYRILGFLIFELVSFKIDHWVFVLRCYKHGSHALIWLIWWFENNLKFYGLKLHEIGNFVQLSCNW